MKYLLTNNYIISLALTIIVLGVLTLFEIQNARKISEMGTLPRDTDVSICRYLAISGFEETQKIFVEATRLCLLAKYPDETGGINAAIKQGYALFETDKQVQAFIAGLNKQEVIEQ